MATTYETTYETTTKVSAPADRVPIALNGDYVRTIPGILKIVQMVVSFIVIICASATPYWNTHGGGGFVTFVAVTALISSAVFFLFYLMNLIYRLPGPWVLIEFIVLCVTIGLYLIAMIVSASSHWHGGGAIAAAIFCIAADGVYIADCFLRFRVYRSSGSYISGQAGAGTTTVTTTSTTPAYPPPAYSGGQARGDSYVP